MIEHGVLVAGGGPAGLMLGAELVLAGVDVGIVERRADQALVGSRAGGFHSRTLEVLDQRGILDRFLAEGQVAQVLRIGSTVLDMSDFPTRHSYSLGIWQNRIEPPSRDLPSRAGSPPRPQCSCARTATSPGSRTAAARPSLPLWPRGSGRRPNLGAARAGLVL